MSSARVLGWVKGRAKQKRSLTFCVFLDTKAFARIEKKECNFLGNFLLLLLAPMRACHNLRGLVTIYLYATPAFTDKCISTSFLLTLSLRSFDPIELSIKSGD
jgi:hypothetical protein